MFTGIVEETGTVKSITGARNGSCILRIGCSSLMTRDVVAGASIAVNGVCLTVVQHGAEWITFDVVQETMTQTTFNHVQPGSRVNLERALSAGGRMDGHMMQGHVDGTATVARITPSYGAHVVWFAPDAHLTDYMIPKGSVAIDGVSLTIASVQAHNFSIALIPTTLERTTLNDLKPNQRVNIESDIIARTVVHYLRRMQSPSDTNAITGADPSGESGNTNIASRLTLEALRQAGMA